MADPASSDCPSLEQLAALDTHLDPVLDTHLRSCPACAERLAMMRENESLLRRIRRATGSGAAEAGEAVGPPDVGAAPAAAIAGYELLGELHRGGQGVVYEALQHSTRRRVAVKVLLGGVFATERQRRRFEREVELVASLRHPGIVTIHDSGITADGRPWLAMERIDGATLGDFVASGRATGTLPLCDLLRLFVRICDALACAHRSGVLHRDLKPGNIMVDGAGEPHIVDFGLARPIDPLIDGAEWMVTVPGGFMGTVVYASPEHAAGGGALIDVRSDVYALGVILYELLGGGLPYPIEGRLSEILTTIAEQPPLPLRLQPATIYPVDRDLETITATALAKDPQRRYQSADALGRDIERYLAGAAIDARRDSPSYVLWRTLTRHKATVGVAAGFLLLLAASSVISAVLYQRASAEADKLADINIFLEDTLASAEARQDQVELTAGELFDEAARWIELVVADEPEVEAALRTIVGNGYRNIERHAEAEVHLARGLELRRRIYGEGHAETARGLSALAHLRRDQGDLDEAERLLHEALRVRRAAGGDDLPLAWTLSALATVRELRGAHHDAADLLTEARAIVEGRRGADHPDVAMLIFRQAELERNRGRVAAAIDLHRQALTMRRRTLDPRHPDLPRSLLALGGLLVEQGRAAEARPLLSACVLTRRGIYGDDHRLTEEARRALERAEAAQ